MIPEGVGIAVSEVTGPSCVSGGKETEQAGTDGGVEACLIPLKPETTVADDGEIPLTPIFFLGLRALRARRGNVAAGGGTGGGLPEFTEPAAPVEHVWRCFGAFLEVRLGPFRFNGAAGQSHSGSLICSQVAHQVIWLNGRDDQKFSGLHPIFYLMFVCRLISNFFECERMISLS